MARTHPKYQRSYMDGYDFSGVIRSLGTMGVTFQESPDAALSDAVMNVVLGRGSFVCGPVNAFLSPESAGTTGLHEHFSTGTQLVYVMNVLGTLGGPAMGDPIFAACMEQASYTGEPGDGIFPVNVTFPSASAQGPLNYNNPFGVLVHPYGAETAANTANSNVDNGAATTKGGIFVYQLFSSDGTVTLSLDDSANGTTWLALSGATSGSINASVTPAAGMVQLGVTATVRRYVRWQVALDTATTATFALGLIRGT